MTSQHLDQPLTQLAQSILEACYIQNLTKSLAQHIMQPLIQPLTQPHYQRPSKCFNQTLTHPTFKSPNLTHNLSHNLLSHPFIQHFKQAINLIQYLAHSLPKLHIIYSLTFHLSSNLCFNLSFNLSLNFIQP